MIAESRPDAGRLEGLLVAGSAVILTGKAAERACQAVLIAIRARRQNGLPDSPAYRELAATLSAVSATGLSDVRESVAGQDISLEPTVPLTEAAERLGLTERQTRRLAPKLGGRKRAGRWFVDADALTEHLEGKRRHGEHPENAQYRTGTGRGTA